LKAGQQPNQRDVYSDRHKMSFAGTQWKGRLWPEVRVYRFRQPLGFW
jgi:hypothetical protein